VTTLHRTPLYDFHIDQGAKFSPFAGYEMPVQYRTGSIAEHRHTRNVASLFDVSHMGQIVIRPRSGNMDDAARQLEHILPLEIGKMPDGRQKYGLLTNENSGIRDDLIVARKVDHFAVVVNAANKDSDLEYLHSTLGGSCHVTLVKDRGIVAIQGRQSEACLRKVIPDLPAMKFMDVRDIDGEFGQLWVSRAGYTGGDGFEISADTDMITELSLALVNRSETLPAGLAARDTLRLEAGLCLHGNDIDMTTTIVESGLEWSVNKSRKPGGNKAGGFVGAEVFMAELRQGPTRRRVGLQPESKAILRAGFPLYSDEDCTNEIGKVTSGGFGPTVENPVAMGYVAIPHDSIDTRVYCKVRRSVQPVLVTRPVFLPTSFVK